MAWVVVHKALASHHCGPGLIPGSILCEKSCALVLLCHKGFSLDPSVFLPPEKSNTFNLWLYSVVIFGSVWLAAKGALVCLRLERVVAASFAIQLLSCNQG